MNIIDLHLAVSKVCPIEGVSVGDADDKATWRIDYRPEATTAQKAAAVQTIAKFDPNAVSDVEPRLVPKRAIVDRLHAAGQLDAALAVLARQDAYTQQRWLCRDAIYHNDSTLLAAFAAIGADPNTIMAP